ncbi:MULTISPECIES: hypothetical protein [Gammaproteobacteria]|uniref:hypothetical protein n=1 Tax=Gammaproteobacteria TaxID=1236 RepID=UPI000C694262|nr:MULTISPECIES: hypothetical protein [Gammaproteobacteria]MAL36884.1 hypothetical protein [Pseudomonas sp.]MBK3797377.1 hypothetical protein [Stutzerimonas stutzeri]MBK3876217.1 hypothetical protein [Stutzerimonas stutzeri]UNG19151.1 hypothetical protein MKP10_02505 [Stutzerimonas zhaodongensis]HBM09482.1 hypothetical protein [Pseudomonas sp.]
MAARLGTKIDNPNLQPNEFFLHGKLLCTDNSVQRVCESPLGLVHQLYMQMQALVAEQVLVREQQQARLEAARVQNRG